MESVGFYGLLALLPLLLLLIKFFSDSYGSRDSSLRLPPGPWQLPLIGSLHHLLGRPHALSEMSRRHGPVMLLRFGKTPVIVASTADAAREILRTHDSNFSASRPQSAVVKILTKRGAGITFAHGEQWRQMRKVCNLELLSSKRIQSFRPVREEEAARLVQSVVSSPAAPATVNLSELLANYVVDTAGHIIMGERFRERDALLHYIDEAVRLASSFTLADMFPSSKLARMMSTTLHKAEVYAESLMEFIDRAISEHLERRSCQDASQEDLIDVLLRLQAEGNMQFPLTMDVIKAVIFDLFGGGTESATTTLQWAMSELMRNPNMLSKAQAEVREAFKEKMKVTEEGLPALSYLHCIIKETLRLHVPGPFSLPKVCQEQCQILGYNVPKGATVLINLRAITRDPKSWDERERFMPERFERTSIDFKGNNFEFIPFSAGRRICPGIQFGLANIELALASLLFYFDWSLPAGVLPADLDMTETMGLTARKKVDLCVQATPYVQLPQGF